jgi:integrase
MTPIKLKYIHSFVDRHGKRRNYFRRRGHKQIALPSIQTSPEFLEAYLAALSGKTAPKREIGVGRSKAGAVDAVVTSYLASETFGNLALETQRTRRNILNKFRREHPDKQIAALAPKHIKEMLKNKSTPTVARGFLKAVRALMAYCIEEEEIIEDDPTAGIKAPRIESDGFYSWNEDDIAAFEKQHPIGTRARKAFALLIYTLQRRSDIVRLGPQHIRNGGFQLRQQKTGTLLSIPVHPELKRILEVTPNEHLTFLTTRAGKPFSPAGFTNWFHKMCEEAVKGAGLTKGASAHGLRKAGCRRLAEAGCSEKQIAALSGHLTLAEVQRYTKAADQARLAEAAMASMVEAFPADRSGTPTGKPAA